ncbi:hypothetical protein [Christiangramia crocea]|uniref:Uncharacterized protein n=1 Tax=Christiangramia crocea TaxID=2904124 RepID=A0A9X1UVJ2_9FLAO|nr:hypothetical protein [Gramella crocea]MCG9971172.1 hypothetical protein [Gramella crocea]
MSNDIELQRDQAKLRKRNREYLEKFVSEYFESAYSKISSKYETLLLSELFDPEDLQEKRKFLKDHFARIKKERPLFYDSPYHFFSSIKVENGVFKYCIDEILRNTNDLVNEIYPTLDIKTGQSASFQFFTGSLRTSAEKVYLKNLLEVNSITFNPAVFNCIKVQEFFELSLYKNWLSRIEDCKPQLSYIYKRLKGSGSYIETNDPGSIICTSKVFMNYWNSLNHPFKIEERKNSNISLHNEPGFSHKSNFDAFLQDFLTRNA